MGVAGAIGGALISGFGAKKAADAQRDAARSDLTYQRETRDLARADLQPWRTGGNRANAALMYELGLGPKPTWGGTMPKIEEISGGGGRPIFNTFPGGQQSGQGGVPGGGITGWMLGDGRIPGNPGGGMAGGGSQFRVGDQTFGTRDEAEAYARQNRTGGTEYGGYTKTPGYDFRMKQGTDAIESSAAARGGLYSGAALQDALQYGQDYASSEYGNYLARLGNASGAGQAAATGQANAAQVGAQGVSNALAGYGNAGAAGAIGVGNAITGGMQNLAGLWNYQRNMGGGQGGINVGAPGSLFSGGGGGGWGG